jgi:hypothetical protein
MTADPAPTQRGGDQADEPEPVYDTVQDWVSWHFLPMYRRPLGGEYRWCPQWWRHAEAITRLTALWQSWEAMRLQPGTGISTWLRDHLDHQLPVLLGRSGPFAQCSEYEHIDPRIAAADLAPSRWWDTGDDETDGAPPQPPPGHSPETGQIPRSSVTPQDSATGEQP